MPNQMGMQQQSSSALRVRLLSTRIAICTVAPGASCQIIQLETCNHNNTRPLMGGLWLVQLGAGNMVMSNGMIPVPGHGGGQLSSMVPVGGMQQSNHLNQPMQGACLLLCLHRGPVV